MTESKNTSHKGSDDKKIKEEPKKAAGKGEEEKRFISTTTENIEAGAAMVSEKVSKIADKTAETAGELYQRVKKGFESAYTTGAKWVDELTQVTQDYINKYQSNAEIKKLSQQRDELTIELGKMALTNYRQKETSPGKLMKEKEIVQLIGKIDALDKEIVKIGKNLDTK